MQCISPEVVETQFAFKLHDKDPEKAAATYERIKVGPLSGTDEPLTPSIKAEGTLAFRVHPSSQPVVPPRGLGLGVNMLERMSGVGGPFCFHLTPLLRCFLVSQA